MDLTSFIKIAQPARALGVKVTKNGELICEWMPEGEPRRNIYSATKSFTSCAVGFAEQEGLLSLDEKIVDIFPEDLPENVSENLKALTIKDLITMQVGQENAELMMGQRIYLTQDNWIKYALAIPFTHKPGTRFVYSNVGPYLAGRIVEKRSGARLLNYLVPRLFTPLGIKLPTWETDYEGNTFGASGLFLTLSELNKFGLFYLNKGKWNGKQLLNEKWIESSLKRQCLDIDYGYNFWGGEHGSYRADGAFGQCSIIFPDKNAVVTFIAESREVHLILQAVYEEIYPQL